MPHRILIFDSGVGALTIARELQRTATSLELVIAMDSGGFPYGAWAEGDLQNHICTLATQLIERYQPDMFVVACNTLSTTALPALRQLTDIPVVGVVPAIKPAAAISKSRVIGLLATPGTVRRAYTDELIRDFAADCDVLRVGSTDLVAAVEALYRHGEDDAGAWRTAIESFSELPRADEMDTIVLACTHFPLVLDKLRAHAPPSVQHWVDSAEAIARRVISLLPDQSGTGNPAHRAVLVDAQEVPAALRDNLSVINVDHVETLATQDEQR